MTDGVDRSVALKREGEVRLAIKRLAKAALSCQVDVTVERRDLELVLACWALKKAPAA